MFSIIQKLKIQASESKMLNHHAACICKKTKILSNEVNILTCINSIHAELNAIKSYLSIHNITLSPSDIECLTRGVSLNKNKMKDIIEIMKGVTLVVVRVNNNNELKESKPCQNCLSIIKMFKIKKIIYSVESGIIFEKTENMKVLHVSQYFRLHKKN